MKFLIKQEYSRRVFLIKFVFVSGSGERGGEIHTPGLRRSETRQGFYLDSAHQHTEHTPQLLTHKNCGRCIFSRVCVMLFLSLTARRGVLCCFFPVQTNKKCQTFCELRCAMQWIKEFANKCDDRIGRTMERRVHRTIGPDERWEEGGRRGDGGWQNQ